MKTFPPISDEFSTLIASREFILSYGTKKDKIIVEVGIPVHDVETIDSYDWRCPVRITTVGGNIIHDHACGCDSFQALDIAINQLIKLKLEGIAQEKYATILLYGEEYNF